MDHPRRKEGCLLTVHCEMLPSSGHCVSSHAASGESREVTESRQCTVVVTVTSETLISRLQAEGQRLPDAWAAHQARLQHENNFNMCQVFIFTQY